MEQELVIGNSFFKKKGIGKYCIHGLEWQMEE